MRTLLILLMAVTGITVSAQTNPAHFTVKHDTVILKSSLCEWMVKTLVKNDPSLTPYIGKSVPELLLKAIEKGKIRAIDPETYKAIPAKQINTWRMTADTVMKYDESGNSSGYAVSQRLVNPAKITQIRLYHDVEMNIASGRFYSVVKYVDLMIEINDPSGTFIGYSTFCRIYY